MPNVFYIILFVIFYHAELRFTYNCVKKGFDLGIDATTATTAPA